MTFDPKFNLVDLKMNQQTTRRVFHFTVLLGFCTLHLSQEVGIICTCHLIYLYIETVHRKLKFETVGIL